MNNLAVYVASPLQRWLAALEALPDKERTAAVAEVEPYLAALPEELPGCEGNAFYALHSCINHNCEPNAHAWKREKDVDGSGVHSCLRLACAPHSAPCRPTLSSSAIPCPA